MYRVPAVALLIPALACCAPVVTADTTAPIESLHASTRSFAVAAPVRADMIYSPGMLRFVGGDEAAAVRLTNGLLETSSMLSDARCVNTSSDPAMLRPLLQLTEAYVLYVVVFSLAYEFDFGVTAGVDKGPKQTLAILHALDERLETSSILFPKLELLTPEDAALLVDSHSTDDLSMFPTYVELLYSMSTANADLADKKARIAAKISSLRDAVNVFYFRAEHADSAELCDAIHALDTATSDALLWAVSDVQRVDKGRRSISAAYGLEVTVAVTNTSPDSTVVLQPRASLRVKFEDESVGSVVVEDIRLSEERLIDNNIPPGFTQVRTFEGLTQRGIIGGCEVDLEVVISGEVHGLSVLIGDCGSPGER